MGEITTATPAEELSPEVAAQVSQAVALARSISKATLVQEGDVEGHSFDDDDIVERHAVKNVVCCS